MGSVLEPAIVADELVKCFGNVEAVKGVSFAVPPGAIVALLGANGAGKSTTIDRKSVV